MLLLVPVINKSLFFLKRIEACINTSWLPVYEHKLHFLIASRCLLDDPSVPFLIFGRILILLKHLLQILGQMIPKLKLLWMLLLLLYLNNKKKLEFSMYKLFVEFTYNTERPFEKFESPYAALVPGSASRRPQPKEKV
jgi:hypothetical protein